ncbi:amidohydrolase family protein [Candidatus Palauibacter sp.]|uniref:amidohydrolase family protein n=1 Tax=Candidatus Palauibacter sp. TaxID=3101350 RepID=UPI003B02C3E4
MSSGAEAASWPAPTPPSSPSAPPSSPRSSLNYVWGGLTEVEALRTATSVAASALAMDGEIGTLTGGALADMLIVEGNPLDDISDLRRARIVIKDGEVFRLEDLLEPPGALVP